MLLPYFILFLLYIGDGWSSKDPVVVHRCSENATYKKCPSACPRTCEYPIPGVCTKNCAKEGCECDPDYVLNNGRCIKFEDCPDAKYCSANQTFVACAAGCPTDYCPQDDSRYGYACDQPSPCHSGCVCKGGYLKLDYDKQTCILGSECPPIPCTRQNEEWNPCPSICLAHFCSDLYGEHEISECKTYYSDYCTPRCVCEKNFYRNNTDDCVPAKQCPQPVLECGYNEEAVKCRTICPPQNCDIIYSKYACTGTPKCEPGCDCIKDHLRNQSGICVPQDSCFAPSTSCEDENAIYTECMPACTRTCENPSQKCIKICRGSGCTCKSGYVLHEGWCIPLQECPGTTCAENATYTDCMVCTSTCDNPFPICTLQCTGSGCSCNPGYVLHEGRCILFGDCPGAKECSSNQSYVPCVVGCPTNYCPRDDLRVYPQCSPPYPCPLGCVCKNNYLISNIDNACILASECPPVSCTRDNEEWNPCPSACLAESCSDFNQTQEVSECSSDSCRPRCVCKKNYYRNENDVCVPARECQQTVLVCGYNEEPVKCQATCPPQNCEIAYTEYTCPEQHKCEPGCNCIKDHLRNSSGICILNDLCEAPGLQPECGLNEELSSCKITCPPQTCESKYALYSCPERDVNSCEPGCNCKAGYLRNRDGVCILSEQCPGRSQPECELNEEFSSCKITCPPQSCESIYTSYLCAQREPNSCEPGCNCKDGYLRNSEDVCIPSKQCPGLPTCDLSNKCLPTCANPRPIKCRAKPYVNAAGCGCQDRYILSELGGKCIKIEDCPKDQGCNGDPNAIIQSCPWSSPATCDSPNASYDGNCKSPGCVCASGYILSKIGGECILPDKCPGGEPCGRNASFFDCGFRCPNQYCPENDSLFDVACKPGRPCPPGCVCKFDYSRKSYDDDTCMHTSDCSPVECTRENEVWNPCPRCLAEKCENYNVPNICDDLSGTNCDPQCICIQGYYRNSTGDCVPLEKCPKKCPIPEECRPTCAVPNPPNCKRVDGAEKNDDGCQCMSGYVLSELGGKCIKIDECPTNIGCNGDEHAVIKEYPLACPSTCDSPNATPCKKGLPVGCECASGYILSENGGKCISPDECKGGNPCGVNGTFVSSRFECPRNYCPVDDSRNTVICEPPYRSLSGCACRLNYLRLSYEDPKCIASFDCPPVNCTRQNEVWNPCPSACLGEYCANVDDPPTVCYTLIFLCNPRCVCEKNNFRDSNDLCIPAQECREINKK